jgi:hypothetical protein
VIVELERFWTTTFDRETPTLGWFEDEEAKIKAPFWLLDEEREEMFVLVIATRQLPEIEKTDPVDKEIFS